MMSLMLELMVELLLDLLLDLSLDWILALLMLDLSLKPKLQLLVFLGWVCEEGKCREGAAAKSWIVHWYEDRKIGWSRKWIFNYRNYSPKCSQLRVITRNYEGSKCTQKFEITMSRHA
jgi:hypothetical protein